ncbi:MAG: ABC transporter ATP-binding protein [Phycisphaerae bacterium]|jgi:phospholipid/cholesterol/gamma-HCH transport system ATP-binding protein|nr:ABC transporter ATP-binding protein [Phycisphaerae bacterium]MBT5365058.1 ABC transporter ATP-binding protein [Phycisphaerae bacterium]MBT6269639.1 ABC transporter ATP-binding protein [Phycisphaerae bacterium]MBT6282957.1 ABC transporter ATP-binding protein [Phycisphaerae bacterium]
MAISCILQARLLRNNSNLENEPIISVRDLVCRFGEQTVLDGVDVDVLDGEVLVIMGGSGSGKSTLLRHMIGTFIPDSGTVKVFGQDLASLNESEMNTVRRKFGILFQSGALFNSMSVTDNVALSLREHTDLDPDIIEFIVKIKLEQVGLREAAEKFPSQISGGMKKRAGLARALALDPKLLFYDEPSAGLDPVTSATIDKLILDLAKKAGATSVVVTHEMDSAFVIADRIAMLDKGKMLMVDTREAFEKLRDWPIEQLDELDERQQLIRQFLCGDAEGPLTKRKEESSYAEDLLGIDAPRLTQGPSIQSSKE